MPSSYKTPHLGLNKWIGTDKPKRHDWNTDNETIDTACLTLQQQLETHQQNKVEHVTATERNKWNAGQQVQVFTYTGNGDIARQFVLGATIRYAVLYAIGCPPLLGTPHLQCYTATLSTAGCSLGASLIAGGFAVQHQKIADPSGFALKLNEPGKTYLCLYWV